MKKMFVLFIAAAAFSAQADPKAGPESLEAQHAGRAPERSEIVRQLKPNEAALGKVVCSGIAVHVVKTDNPLQLINPFAPLEYGAAEINVAQDPISRKVSGLKFFSFGF